LWQANPSKTNMELINAIQTLADRATNPDSVYGYGVPNFCKIHAYINESMTSIDEFENMEVYPNPFHNYFQISFYTTKDENVMIELFDVTGKKIRSQQNDVYAFYENRFIIDEGTGLAHGMYFIKIKT